jgi:hypothetical protein
VGPERVEEDEAHRDKTARARNFLEGGSEMSTASIALDFPYTGSKDSHSPQKTPLSVSRGGAFGGRMRSYGPNVKHAKYGAVHDEPQYCICNSLWSNSKSKQTPWPESVSELYRIINIVAFFNFFALYLMQNVGFHISSALLSRGKF